MANTSYDPEITSFESPFQPTTSTVRVNTLWLVGLVLSLMASLFCIFVKQWVRMYMKWAEVTPLQTAMALRQYRYNGLQQWGLPAALAIMPGILQLALALFLVGLVDLLLPIHLVVGMATAVVVYGFLAIAATLTLLPLVWRTCPFKTPVIEAVLPIIYKTTRPCISLIRSIIHWYYYSVYDGYNQQISSYIDYLGALVQDIKRPSVLGFWKWLDVRQAKNSEKSLSEPLSVSAIGHLYSSTPNETILSKILPCLGLYNPSRAKLANAWPVIAVLAGVNADSWRLPADRSDDVWIRELCQLDGFRPRKLQSHLTEGSLALTAARSLAPILLQCAEAELKLLDQVMNDTGSNVNEDYAKTALVLAFLPLLIALVSDSPHLMVRYLRLMKKEYLPTQDELDPRSLLVNLFMNRLEGWDNLPNMKWSAAGKHHPGLYIPQVPRGSHKDMTDAEGLMKLVMELYTYPARDPRRSGFHIIMGIALPILGEPSCLGSHQDWVTSIAFSSDDQYIASGSDDKTVRLWNVQTGALAHELKGHQDWVRSVTFSPDGQYIASGSDDKTIRLWDVQTGALAHELKGHQGMVRSVAFSPDGQHIASGSLDKTVRLWDVQTGALAHELKGHQEWVRSIAFSPNSQHIASGSWDKTVRLWDVHTGTLAHELKGHQDWIRSIAFSPDSQYIASGSDDKTVRLWNVHTGSLAHELQGHQSLVISVVFSPDGQHIASGSSDKTVRLWNVQTGALAHELKGHQEMVISMAFSPDGQHIASGSSDKTLRLWDVKTGLSHIALKVIKKWSDPSHSHTVASTSPRDHGT
jgi:WD40 repeat protein